MTATWLIVGAFALLLVALACAVREAQIQRAKAELARAAAIEMRRLRDQARLKRDYHRAVSVELTEDLEHSGDVIARLLDEREERERRVH